MPMLKKFALLIYSRWEVITRMGSRRCQANLISLIRQIHGKIYLCRIYRIKGDGIFYLVSADTDWLIWGNIFTNTGITHLSHLCKTDA